MRTSAHLVLGTAAEDGPAGTIDVEDEDGVAVLRLRGGDPRPRFSYPRAQPMSSP